MVIQKGNLYMDFFNDSMGFNGDLKEFDGDFKGI